MAIESDLFAADFLHDVAQAFDFRHEGLDVGLRDLEIGIVARFDVGALQQVEQAFLLGRVARERPAQFDRVCLAASEQLVQIVILRAIQNMHQRHHAQ